MEHPQEMEHHQESEHPQKSEHPQESDSEDSDSEDPYSALPEFFPIEFFMNPAFANTVGAKIFSYLDPQSRVNCRLVSPKWYHFVDERLDTWKAMIRTIKARLPRSHFKELNEIWDKMETVKTFDHWKTMANHFKDFNKFEDVDMSSMFQDRTEYERIHFIFGNLERLKFCQPFLTPEQFMCRFGQNWDCILHLCAKEGKLDMYKYISQYVGGK